MLDLYLTIKLAVFAVALIAAIAAAVYYSVSWFRNRPKRK